MKKFRLGAFLAAALISLKAEAAPNVLDLKYSIEDSNIVYPESFETGTQKLLERWYLKNYTSTDLEKSSSTDPDPGYDVIRRRLADLPTVIDMPCNQIVVSYIERFTKRGRPQLAAMLGLATYYMPIFEQALEEAQLPLELKYLPVIESALDPTAVSKHGATGLWQFMLAPAKGFDMEVNSLVDERRDPYISSEKACRFLKDLYNTYGDWSLAIAAYNCGPGNVNKALRRAGGDAQNLDFWSIYYYLPEETRGYVPMFIAANYVMTYYPEHNISPVLPTKPLVTDTIHVSDRVHFNQICAVLDIPLEEIRILNPQFRADIIPGSAEHPYNLILPSQQIHAYLISENQIHDYEREKYARRLEAIPGGDPNFLEEISEEVVAENLEPLNPADLAPAEEQAAGEMVAALETSTQEAATPRRRRNSEEASATPAPDSAAAKEVKQKETEKPKETQKQTADKKKVNNKTAEKADTKKAKKAAAPKDHTVAKGENLTVIAKKYGVTVAELQAANKQIKNDAIKAGDKINIPSKASAKATSSKSKKKKSKKKK